MLPPKGIYLPISKLHSILAVVNLLAHNNISQICYCCHIYYRVLQLTAAILTPFGVTFILLAMVEEELRAQGDSIYSGFNIPKKATSIVTYSLTMGNENKNGQIWRHLEVATV